ncbi:hypothetical protein F0310_01165 [Borrelia sp. A-FGy1]|nr:hypothetical protein F0310_01165 [Borrelia sp. A-FGy1]
MTHSIFLNGRKVDPTFKPLKALVYLYCNSWFLPGFIDQTLYNILLMSLGLLVQQFVKEVDKNPFFPFIIRAILISI